MKKVLFATTALVLTAGVAAAEVTVSGDGRMGVRYDGQKFDADGIETVGNEWNFNSRARVTFTLSGQTDGGLEFGGSFRADQAGDSAASNGAAYGLEGSVYISGAFGKIEMGDVVGASEALFGDFYEVGYSDLTSVGGTMIVGELSDDIPYLTGDNGGFVWGNVKSALAVTPTSSGSALTTTTVDVAYSSGPNLLYTGTFGAFSVAASMSDGKAGGADASQEYAVAAAYTFGGNYTVGMGYEVVDADVADVDMLTLAGVAKFGNTSVKAAVSKLGKDADANYYGLGFSSVFGATTVGGYVQKVDDKSTDNEDVTWYGLGAEYDLGGGAVVKGGIADNDLSGTDAVADLGIKFSF
ncbi:MAG: porin [Thioclava marina]|uniref:porin n=1 Tax=Thioclava marina TaxID=1915077 RepID=UPI0019B9A16B|nr:porin [Thioclava marina]MBC7144543.1 porin [Thioclava marina]